MESAWAYRVLRSATVLLIKVLRQAEAHFDAEREAISPVLQCVTLVASGRYALNAGDHTLVLRLKLQLDGALASACTITTAVASMLTIKRLNSGALAR